MFLIVRRILMAADVPPGPAIETAVLDMGDVVRHKIVSQSVTFVYRALQLPCLGIDCQPTTGITRTKAETLIVDGATVSDSLGRLASTAEVILSCLTDDAAVRRVYLAPDGMFAHAARGTIVLEMSTIRPRTSRELARDGVDCGIHVLDVAIPGSTPAVEQGTVTLLCGGELHVFAAVEPLLKTIANSTFTLVQADQGRPQSWSSTRCSESVCRRLSKPAHWEKNRGWIVTNS
jgi:hypothetical protein